MGQEVNFNSNQLSDELYRLNEIIATLGPAHLPVETNDWLTLASRHRISANPVSPRSVVW